MRMNRKTHTSERQNERDLNAEMKKMRIIMIIITIKIIIKKCRTFFATLFFSAFKIISMRVEQ